MLDTHRGALLCNEVETKLRPKSYAVLRYLIENNGKLVSRQELLDAVWKDAVVTDDSVTQCLIEIRKAFGDSAQDLVKTVPRRGYIFRAQVESLAKQKSRTSEKLANPRWPIVYASIAATAVAILLGLFLILMQTPLDSDDATTSPRDTDLTVIAVMPLVNMSSHEENAYFAGGVHADVLSSLSRVGDFQVISRTTMLRYAASDMNLREIGTDLGADFIVEGSVRRIGNHVRVTVQLINAKNDLHHWANNYERELVDVFATQSELAREISDSIHLELQPDSVRMLEGMPTTSVKAYDLYVRAGDFEKSEGETEVNMLRRREMLEQAVAEDPNFVEAWAVLKRVYDLQMARVRIRDWYLAGGQDKDLLVEDLRDRSRHALNKAIALDPDNVESLLSQAVDHDWPKTREEMQAQKNIFDQIVATSPEHAKTWYHLGWWHTHLADLPGPDFDTTMADASAAFNEALRLDPFNARIVAATLTWHRNRGHQEDVERLSERFNQIFPETAADRQVARESWVSKRNQIVSAFLATADVSISEKYKLAWQQTADKGDFPHFMARLMDEAEHSIFTNDQDRLVELSHLSIDLEESQYHFIVFISFKSIGMRLFTDRGDLEQARLIALSVLEQEEAILAQGVIPCVCWTGTLARVQNRRGLGTLAQAYTVLGDFDEARRLNEQLLEQAKLNRLARIRSLAFLDIDQAVDEAFKEHAKNPSWEGFDALAAHWLFDGGILSHPRVQAHYVEEGKWVGYLAARLPAYVQYSEVAE